MRRGKSALIAAFSLNFRPRRRRLRATKIIARQNAQNSELSERGVPSDKNGLETRSRIAWKGKGSNMISPEPG
jgi:hypothetical protein